MKIVLVNPPSFRFGYYLTEPVPPLGLLYLSQYAMDDGHTVEIIDIPTMRWSVKKIVKIFRDLDCDLIGFSANIFTLREAYSLIKLTRLFHPTIKIVVGGPCSVYPNESILEIIKEMDYFIRGDGEIPFQMLCRALEGKIHLDQIPNLTYRLPTGEIIKNNQTYLTDLSSIPFPPLHLINLKDYVLHPPYLRKKPFMIVQTSRGCPYNCSFCVVRQNYRRRSLESVINEISKLKTEHGVKEIYFCDPSFTSDPNFVIDLCKEMIKRNLIMPWTCKSRIDNVPEKMLKYMKNAGCYLIAFGAESGDAAVLKAINKHIEPEDIARTIKRCRKIGILSLLYFMVGNPRESERSLRITERFLYDNIPDFAIFAPVLPLPDTQIVEDPVLKKYNYEEQLNHAIFSLKPPKWPIYIPEGMTEDQVLYWVSRLQRNQFFNPKYLWHRIIHLNSLTEFLVYVKGMLKLIKELVQNGIKRIIYRNK